MKRTSNMPNGRESITGGWVALAAIAIISCSARPVSAAAQFRLERESPFAMYVAPGNHANYLLRITNIGNEPGIAPLYAIFWYENRHDPAPYSLEQSGDPRCGPLHVDSPYPGSWEYGPAFETASIAPGASLECDMTVVRPAASVRDTSLQWTIRDTEPPYAFRSEDAFIGTLADTSFDSRTLEFSIDSQGIAHSLLEVSVHNGSPVAIAPTGVGTCVPPAPPFDIDTDFEGGCPSYSVLCPGLSYGIGTPQLDPDQTYRCHVRLRSFQPYTAPLQFQLMLGIQASVGGGTLMNINSERYSGTLTLGPFDTLSAQAVPVNRMLYALFFLLVAAAGMRLNRTTGN